MHVSVNTLYRLDEKSRLVVTVFNDSRLFPDSNSNRESSLVIGITVGKSCPLSTIVLYWNIPFTLSTCSSRLESALPRRTDRGHREEKRISIGADSCLVEFGNWCMDEECLSTHLRHFHAALEVCLRPVRIFHAAERALRRSRQFGQKVSQRNPINLEGPGTVF